MIKRKYLKEITNTIHRIQPSKNTQFFLYGSSLIKERFGDVDLGIVGDVKVGDINKLKEEFTNSALPYFVDVVNFNKVSKTFKENVFNNKIVWIKP